MSAELRDLTGTVVAVIGASAGIGRATARQLVEAGAKVALGARRMDRLEELVQELGQENAHALELDVTDRASVEDFIRGAREHFGRLDSVVANAGLGFYGGITDLSDEDIQTMIDVNLAGTVWTVRAAVPAFREQGGGDLVIVASVAGLRGGADEAVYAATKHAQVGLAGSIDRELRPEGIRVTSICPAGTNTEFALGAGREEGDPSLEEYMTPEDIAFQIITTLRQPRRLRTTLWASWSMSQGS